jgi:outer membrane immunogenic protein
MKRFIMAAVAIVAMATAATKPASAAGPSFDWSGFYAGAVVGYGWGSSDWNDIFGTYQNGPDDIYRTHLLGASPDGVLGGGTLGYSFQRGSLVYGVEGDFAFTGMSDQGHCFGNVDNYSATCATDTKWVSTVAARLGWAMNRALIFGKGGLAVGRFEYDIGDFVNFDAPNYNTSSETRVGWTIGGGVEYAITDSISVKMEYDYMDFGTDRVGFRAPCDCEATPFKTDIDQSMHTLKAGLNFQF